MTLLPQGSHKAQALLASSAALALLIVGCGQDDAATDDAGNASANSSATPDSSPSDGESPSTSESASPTDPRAVGVYWVGDCERPCLYREFTQLDAGDPVTAAVRTAVEGTPADPDYQSGWPDDTSVAEVTAAADKITVQLEGAGLTKSLPKAQATSAVQQLIYTAQAAYGEGRVPVTISAPDSDTVLGMALQTPAKQQGALRALSHTSVSNPGEGATVGNTLKANGAINAFEANVQWKIRDAEGTVVRKGFTTAEGWQGNRLFPWKFTENISNLPAGDYTLEVSNGDASDGEGLPAHIDTKNFTKK